MNNSIIIESFKKDIGKAVRENNCGIINDIVSSESYSSLTKAEKDESLLNLALIRFLYLPQNTDFIKYLVFEYQISEEFYQLTATNSFTYSVHKKFENMFETRRLNQELNIELENTNTPEKKPKV